MAATYGSCGLASGGVLCCGIRHQFWNNEHMLLPTARLDHIFKRNLAGAITAQHIELAQIRALVGNVPAFSRLGRAFRSFSSGDRHQAAVQLRADRQVAVGTDVTALFLLTYLLHVLECAPLADVLNFQELSPEGKGLYASLLQFVHELGGRVSLRELVATEVEAHVAGAMPGRHIGQYADSQLGDLLLRGSDDDKEFVAEQLDRLHAAGVLTYDSCFAELLQARHSAASPSLRAHLSKVINRIERQHPAATLRVIATDLYKDISEGADPLKRIASDGRLRALSATDTCVLAIGVADTLAASGQKEAATSLLGAAAQHAGQDPKLKAWIGFALGDKINAAEAMFRYAVAPLSGIDFFDGTERYHAVEAGCRLLFEVGTPKARAEYQRQIRELKRARLDRFAGRVRMWCAALDGFDRYLACRLGDAKRVKIDPNELRISQRVVAERCFLEGAKRPFKACLVRGMKWFEKSATGNDAPWIEGERLLLRAVNDSLDARGHTQARLIERTLVNAGSLLRSTYPAALSLAFRGLFDGAERLHPAAVRDLSLSTEMLEPKTPELLELRERIASARWQILEALSLRRPVGRQKAKLLWMNIARIAPLLSEVIDEDGRIKQHFSPSRDLLFDRQPEEDTIDLLAIGDANERGRALEELITRMVTASSGLRVIDVRHRNEFEEIDIIVSITKYNPLLSYWGPLLLIECKNWREKVGADPIRSFYTKVATKKGAVRLGVMVSPSGFTRGVKELSRLFQDALIIAVGPDELHQVQTRQRSFVEMLESLIPAALFS